MREETLNSLYYALQLLRNTVSLINERVNIRNQYIDYVNKKEDYKIFTKNKNENINWPVKIDKCIVRIFCYVAKYTSKKQRL